MNKTSVALGRRLAVVACLAIVGLTGCSSTGFDTNALSPPGFARGTRGTMDGFVFVPSRGRQAATGTAIPNATIKVYRINGAGQPNTLLFTTQADAEGFYRVEGLPLNVLLLVEAIDPFVIPGQPQRTVTGVISFQVAEDRTRNLNEVSTVAAGIAVGGGSAEPLSDQQVSALEALAEERLSLPGAPDVTADPDALAAVVAELNSDSFGSLQVYVYSDPVVAATVKMNGNVVGTATTLLPGAAPGANLVQVASVARGQVNLTIEAPGFLADLFTVDISPNQASQASRVLVPVPVAGQNKPPTIVDQRTMPARLGFSGGEVAIQAIVIDSDSDAVVVSAEVTAWQPLDRTEGSAPTWTVPLVLTTNHVYSGTLTVPGNASTANATYVVDIYAHDAAHEEARTHSAMTFQVAGTNPPPDPPTTGQ